MPIRMYKPTSKGRRLSSVLTFEDITKTTPEKSLVTLLKKQAGRNNYGNVTCRHRGGGNKRMCRQVDFKRTKDNIPAVVAAIEYDPNRSARLALLHYADGEKRYILAPLGVKVGMKVLSGASVEPEVGNCTTLDAIPVGTIIHNVELVPGRGGQMARAAGAQVRITAREGDYAMISLPSGEVRRVHVKCRATIGQLGNLDHNLVNIGKAGRKRWLGIRPTVRGSCMNPVDHPMGGGEGRRAGGRHPVGPGGVLAKGGKTRNPRKASGRFIIRSRKRGRFQF